MGSAPQQATLTVAFLGPEGSYTGESLARELPHVNRRACNSIWEAFDLLSIGTVPYAFVPLENLIHGPVSEALDSLIAMEGAVTIEWCVNESIIHCLGIPPRKPEEALALSQLQHIYSHPQALYQCSKYLKVNCPNALAVQAASTTAAIDDVAAAPQRTAAAIASHHALVSKGFTVLAEDISDVRNNQTRFALLRGPAATGVAPTPRVRVQRSFRTSLLVKPEKDRQGLLSELLRVISEDFGVNLCAIHSRPDAAGGFDFYMELEGHADDPRIDSCLKALCDFSRVHTGDVVSIISLGSYPSLPFCAPVLQRVGIIGAQGVMGKWFTRFFQDQGLQVTGFDVTATVNDASAPTLQILISESDVVLLSVPMSVIESVALEIAPLLRPDQLVVENCSIKAAALPVLLRLLPEHCELLGIHTMFGGDTGHIRGQNVIVTETNRSRERSQQFADLLYKHGAQLRRSTPERHDEMSAYLQSLVQFVALLFGKALSECGATLDELSTFSTPNSRALMMIAERVIRQPVDLTTDLQLKNPRAAIARKQLCEICLELSVMMEQNLVLQSDQVSQQKAIEDLVRSIRRFTVNEQPAG